MTTGNLVFCANGIPCRYNPREVNYNPISNAWCPGSGFPIHMKMCIGKNSVNIKSCAPNEVQDAGAGDPLALRSGHRGLQWWGTGHAATSAAGTK